MMHTLHSHERLRGPLSGKGAAADQHAKQKQHRYLMPDILKGNGDFYLHVLLETSEHKLIVSNPYKSKDCCGMPKIACPVY